RARPAPSAGTIMRLGASRMSSVFGLNVRPSTATVLPCSEPLQAATTLATIARLRASFTAITVVTILVGTPQRCPIAAIAAMSLGNHEPPKPGPHAETSLRYADRAPFRAKPPARLRHTSRKDPPFR